MTLLPNQAAADREAFLESLGWSDRHNEEVFAIAEIQELVRNTGEWIEALLGPYRGAAAMKAVLLALEPMEAKGSAKQQQRVAATAARIDAVGWREVLEHEADGLADWPSLASDFEWLYAYAIDGIVYEGRETRTIEQRRAQLVELLSRTDHFISLLPPAWEPSKDYRWCLRRIHASAKARWKLDTGERLTVADVALLGRLDEKTVLNAFSDRRLPSSADGTCAAEDARDWLISRRPKKFRPSRWMDPGDDQDSRSPDESADPRQGDTVWVPVDARGDAFLPTLARPTRQGALGFRIGPKGNEQTVGDFFDALSALKGMHPPRWRRPNAEGNWGIVRAEPSWRAMPRAEIDRLLREAGF
ncbi:hypothetical protein [Roseomonas rosulenta]|uniref:hypothetical protein n=1 Tax=Roseomonas rosulenta TaxID=2748667 RepID=UPI0018DF8222|nr:hypothetical protein [Roseomonas rosulenta]